MNEMVDCAECNACEIKLTKKGEQVFCSKQYRPAPRKRNKITKFFTWIKSKCGGYSKE